MEAKELGEMIQKAQKNDELIFDDDYTTLGHDILTRVFPRPDKMKFEVLGHTIVLERGESGSIIRSNLIPDTMLDDNSPENEEWAAMVNGFESLLLALFDAGALSYSQPTITAITTTLESFANRS
jgi:hypothetical protein